LPDVKTLWLSTVQFADREYMIYGDERMTYSEAHRQVAAVANWLVAQGVGSGDRVAIAMRNYPEWMLIYWACACIGAAAVGMNAWWTAAEMAYALADSTPKVLFVDGERAVRIRDQPGLLAGAKLVVTRGDAGGDVAWSEVIETAGPMPRVAIDPDSDVCIFYTSGTTGFPKGARLTHRSCVNNLLNILFAMEAHGLAAERATGVLRRAPPNTSVLLVTIPLFHVTANNCGAYVVTAAGGKLVLMHRWDAGEALKLIERERCTSAGGVPIMAREIVSHPDFDKYDTSSLESVGGGGAQLQPDLVLKIDGKVPTARPSTGYGMTEASGAITWINGDFFVGKPASCGRPMPTFEVKIVGDDGEALKAGQVGELCVKGASVIKGYLNRDDATQEAIVDGWLHTGDVAYIDGDGFLFLVDRKKDMVLRGGENVYCAEVEAALHQHSAVAECSVFGVPDTRLGEEVGVAVVLNPGFSIDADGLRQHCAPLIARHKIPRYIWMISGFLPRNANGKFLKRELRETLRMEDAR
jgi:long-chain acyl-CoA synthetase